MRGKKICCFFTFSYIRKAKCKDKDAKCTSEQGGEEHRENANMVETNVEIKVREEFPAGINVVKGIEGDNDNVPNEVSSRACPKERYENEEGNDKFSRKKEIEQANTEIAVYEDIAFWPRTCTRKLLNDLVTLEPKKFKRKDEPFALTFNKLQEQTIISLSFWRNRTCFYRSSRRCI